MRKMLMTRVPEALNTRSSRTPTASPSAPLEGTLAASALWNFFNRGVISAVRVASVVMARPLLIFPSGASDPSP